MRESPPKICLLADSHELYDDRIYWKQALSLKKFGYEVYYILAGDSNNQGKTAEGINYFRINRDNFPSNRILNYISKRIPGGLYSKMLKVAGDIDADVYHIHDLKVNRIGEKLNSLPQKPKVIYDVHEPYPENILDYGQMPKLLRVFRKQWSDYIRKWERNKVANYDMIITTEENLQQRFQTYFPDKKIEIIYNYTNLDRDEEYSDTEKEYDAIYTGGITKVRGALKILEAVRISKEHYPKIKIVFLGSWFPKKLKSEMLNFIRLNRLTGNVELKEAVPYNQVAELYRKSRIGLGIFLPIQTHKIILQIKIFEYMYFGLPIVGSNFGHISNLIKKHQCGISVDPEDPKEIANALITLKKDSSIYSTMSDNGKNAAEKFYQWDIMEKKLLELYKSLLNQ